MQTDSFIDHLISRYQKPAFIDEVGCGSLFGPTVACAVMIPGPLWISEVDDSKKLKHEQIYRLAKTLREKVIYSIGIVSSLEINELKNICKANLLAWKRAISGLPETPDAIFLDGKYPLKDISIPNYPIVKGDSKVFGIAVASILAKNFRDHLMMNLYGKKYSRYNIVSNKGYRSPDHLIAIRKYGIIPGLHRTYMPQIQRVLKGEYDPVINKKYKYKWMSL